MAENVVPPGAGLKRGKMRLLACNGALKLLLIAHCLYPWLCSACHSFAGVSRAVINSEIQIALLMCTLVLQLNLHRLPMAISKWEKTVRGPRPRAMKLFCLSRPVGNAAGRDNAETVKVFRSGINMRRERRVSCPQLPNWRSSNMPAGLREAPPLY